MIVEIISNNKYGKIVLMEDDSSKYYLMPNQKWLPQEVNNICKFKPRQIVLVTGKGLGILDSVSAVIVAKTRTIKISKNGKAFSQIQIVGLPLCWWSEGHFNE